MVPDEELHGAANASAMVGEEGLLKAAMLREGGLFRAAMLGGEGLPRTGMVGFKGFPRTGQEPARCLVDNPGPPSKRIDAIKETNVLEIILNLEQCLSRS